MMESLLKLSLLALALAVVAASGSRERRFLLDITEGAQDLVHTADQPVVFTWNISSGKFPVQDKAAVTQALSEAFNDAVEIRTESLLLLGAASDYRVYTLYHAQDKNLDKWQAAADALTSLFDATETASELTFHYVAEIMNAVQNNTGDQADLFNKALRSAGIAIDRLERQNQFTTEALMDLRSIKDLPQASTIYGLLTQLINLSNMTNELRGSYRRLIDVAGIESFD